MVVKTSGWFVDQKKCRWKLVLKILVHLLTREINVNLSCGGIHVHHATVTWKTKRFACICRHCLAVLVNNFEINFLLWAWSPEKKNLCVIFYCQNHYFQFQRALVIAYCNFFFFKTVFFYKKTNFVLCKS